LNLPYHLHLSKWNFSKRRKKIQQQARQKKATTIQQRNENKNKKYQHSMNTISKENSYKQPEKPLPAKKVCNCFLCRWSNKISGYQLSEMFLVQQRIFNKDKEFLQTCRGM
jgi:hypothetical protein